MKTEDIFIQRLKMLIAQQGKTVKSVAETLGISPSTFHGRLNIAQKFSPYDLNRIAYHLNVHSIFYSVVRMIPAGSIYLSRPKTKLS